MPLRTSLLLLAASSAALAPLAAGIDLNDPLDGCPPAARPLAAGQPVFNSTGEARLPLPLPAGPDPWYLSLGFRDERQPNAIYGLDLTRQSLDVLVSVPASLPGSPAGRRTSLCVYRLQQQDAAAADEQASCGGVLSDACVAALEGVRPPPADGSCPVPDVSAACGDGAQIVGSTSTPLVFNDTLCSTNATVPDSDAIPDGYRTYVTFASGQLSSSDDSRASFAVYAEHIRRPAPILVTARLGGGDNSTTTTTTTAAKLLCLAPSKVVKGSRGAVVSTSGGAAAAAAAKPVLLVGVLTGVLAAVL